jgi:hypothetical protein
MIDKYLGKKVRILKHFHCIVDDFTNITEVYATKDSICTLLSYEEYSAHAKQIFDSDSEQRSRIKDPIIRRLMEDNHYRQLEWVKSGMMARIRYPARFEKFVPLPEVDYAKLKQDFDIVDIVCHDNAIQILPADIFVIIE